MVGESIKATLWPEMGGSFWLAIGYWSVLVLLAGLEFVVPQIQDMRREHRWPTNFGLGFINLSLAPLSPVSALWAAQWAQSHHVGLLNFLDSTWWPLAAVATIMILSLVGYVVHLVMHKTPWLWRVHRVHHLDTAMDVSTGLRHHPLELVLTLLTDVGAALVFGLMPLALVAYGTADGLFSFFTHANIRLPARLERILRLALVTPRVHALHHSSHQPETDSNYGNVFTIWDRMFGTYGDRRADHPETIQYGLAEIRDTRAGDLWWQLKSPALRLDDVPQSMASRAPSKLS